MAYAPPTDDEVAADYAAALADLTFNSKPIITSLTMIAGENRRAAAAIARTIETRIQSLPPDRVLPLMYLMDSIAKNIGGPFIAAFGPNLVRLFSETYVRADPSTRSALIRMLSTWQGVFSDQSLQQCALFVTQVCLLYVFPPASSSVAAPIASHNTCPPALKPVSTLPPFSSASARPTVPPSSPSHRPATSRSSTSRGLRSFRSVTFAAVRGRYYSREPQMERPAPQVHAPTTAPVPAAIAPPPTLVHPHSVPHPAPSPAFDPNLAALLASPALAQHAGLIQQLMQSGALNAAMLQQLLGGTLSAPPTTTATHYASALSHAVQPPPPMSALAAAHHHTAPAYPPSRHLTSVSSAPSSSSASSSSTSSSEATIARRLHEPQVRALYGDIPVQCTQCGLRFPDREKIRDHLDMHWKNNRRTQAKKVFSRPWYLPTEEWARTATSEGTTKAASSSAIFGDSAGSSSAVNSASSSASSGASQEGEVDASEVTANAKCGVCGEQFEKYYSDEAERWLLRGGIRHPLNNAMLVHRDCLQEELLAKHPLPLTAEPPSKRTRAVGATV